MKLSIIIISYNEKDYIMQAIDSCVNQENPYEYEIIIGDDGSTDGSIDLLAQIKSKYPDIIQYFVMDRDQEISKIIPSLRVTNIIKNALKLCKGEYCTIISADDLILNRRKFVKQIEFLENNYNYFSCYTDFLNIYENGDTSKAFRYGFCQDKFVWTFSYVHISCFVFRNLLSDRLMDRFLDDTGMHFLLLEHGKSKHISGADFGYRQRDSSIMHKIDKLELHIIELMVFQDILNYGEIDSSLKIKYSCSMLYVYLHKNKVLKTKYSKYIESCNNYDNNVLNEIINMKIFCKYCNLFSLSLYSFIRFFAGKILKWL